MSEAFRGVEVHGNQVILPDMTMPFAIGTRHDPVTQAEVMEAVIQGWVRSAAIGEGWDIHGGHFGVFVGVTRTGDAMGVEGRAIVEEGVVMGGNVRGGYFRAEIETGASIAADKYFEGLHIDMRAAAASQILNNAYAIHIHSVMANVVTNEYIIILLDQTGGAIIETFIYASVSAGSDMLYFLMTVQPTTSAWSYTGEPTYTAAYGWIKVKIGAVDRWIKLWDTAPV